MIRYTLQCADGHRFESWFRDAAAYEALAEAGGLVCPSCGSHAVEKSLMAPQVRPARSAAAPDPGPVPTTTEAAPPSPPAPGTPAPHPPAATASPNPEAERAQALARLRAKVEAEADYVGTSFATKARAMHDGSEPERPIYGEARTAEAIALIEDGVPVAPLPFTPTRKLN